MQQLQAKYDSTKEERPQCMQQLSGLSIVCPETQSRQNLKHASSNLSDFDVNLVTDGSGCPPLASKDRVKTKRSLVKYLILITSNKHSLKACDCELTVEYIQIISYACSIKMFKKTQLGHRGVRNAVFIFHWAVVI